VGDCLKPNEQVVNYMLSWREQITVWLDEDDICIEPDQRLTGVLYS